MSKDPLYFDLIDACAETGCPLCWLSLKFTRRYLDSIIYEYVNDLDVRDELRAARGYCNEHAWWLAKIHGSSLGVAIIYEDVVKALLGSIDAVSDGGGARVRAQNLLKRLRPSGECPACTHRATIEDLLVGALLKNIDDERLAAALGESSGLCIPHFTRALELIRVEDALRVLVTLERDKLVALQSELAEFIRKSDYRFHDEGFGTEGDSWRRAIAAVSGERGVR